MMGHHHLAVLALVSACLLLVPSWSGNNEVSAVTNSASIRGEHPLSSVTENQPNPRIFAKQNNKAGIVMETNTQDQTPPNVILQNIAETIRKRKEKKPNGKRTKRKQKQKKKPNRKRSKGKQKQKRSLIEKANKLKRKEKTNQGGICADGKIDPVDTKKHWKDRLCYDLEGNSYKYHYGSLMSCCGCFKFICKHEREGFFWDKILENSCCEDCEGNVFPSGSVMQEKKLEDKCFTTLTTKCIFVSSGIEKKAVIEETSSYENCCTNSSGIYPVGTDMLVPDLCSIKACLRPEGRYEASWILKLMEEGCNCCVHERNLIGEGGWVILSNGKNATCCDGRLLVPPGEVATTTTTTVMPFPEGQKCFLEDTNFTFHDLGKNFMNQNEKPYWIVGDGGRSLIETKNTRPSVGITNLGDPTKSVSFAGRVYSKSSDNDVIGMVFGYQDVANFFVVASSGSRTNWYVGRLHATCVLEPGLANSCANTKTISDAIWNPKDHPKDITILAKGTNYWKYPNKYNFSICFNPSELLIDVSVVEDGTGNSGLATVRPRRSIRSIGTISPIVDDTDVHVSANPNDSTVDGHGLDDSNIDDTDVDGSSHRGGSIGTGRITSILDTGKISAKTNNSAVDAASRKGGNIGVYVDSQALTNWDQLNCTFCDLTK